MDITSFLIMKQELLLTIITLFILVSEISVSDKRRIIPIAIILFGVHTIFGFFYNPYGSIFGGMYQNSELIVLMKNILNIGVFIVLLQSTDWLSKEENKNKISEFFILIFSTLIGMNFMISSGDFLMFYLGLELATIPMASLVAYNTYDKKSSESGLKLIMSAAFSSAVMLFGVSLIYGQFGTLYFSELLSSDMTNPLAILAFLIFISGLSFKISLVPFHFWTADVYEGAPTNVTSYLSVISKGAAVFIFNILLFTVFRNIVDVWSDILYALAVLTMTIGNLFAIRQTNIKRFLAFSSVAQAGFILLGLLGTNELGMATVVYFILIYIFSNLAAFGVIAAIEAKTNKVNIDDYNGLYKTNPNMSLLMMLALFSLAGIPPLAGFFGKFFLFTAAAQNGYYWLIFIAVINATISLYYYLIVVKAMFINKNDNPIEKISNNWYMKISYIICFIGLIVIGFYSDIFEYINQISIGI
ncbi:MAG: NADH-quinone oxidoreductase subunit N [Flavobacteriales bacterium]|nr:NADH-quinone oxidoreductase subunit N [Flavobacteriales bacterium]